MVPGQERVDVAIGPTLGDALEGYFEPGDGIDVIELGGLQECCDRSPAASSSVAAREEGVLSRDRLWADRPFDGIGIDVEPAVLEKALERLTPTAGISDPRTDLM
jgi:hypothetical protein